MSKLLLERLRKGREIRIEVDKRGEAGGKFVFIALRPTRLDMVGLSALDREGQVRRALDAVIGWENVTEDDIGGGANFEPVKFDAALWREWAVDRQDLMSAIVDGIVAAYERSVGAQAEAAKN